MRIFICMVCALRNHFMLYLLFWWRDTSISLNIIIFNDRFTENITIKFIFPYFPKFWWFSSSFEDCQTVSELCQYKCLIVNQFWGLSKSIEDCQQYMGLSKSFADRSICFYDCHFGELIVIWSEDCSKAMVKLFKNNWEKVYY